MNGNTCQIEQECIPAAAYSIVHAIMWHRRCRIGRRQEAVDIGLGIPPFVPFSLVRLALGYPLPLLNCRLGIPVAQQTCPDIVALDISHPQVIQVLERPRQRHVPRHLPGTSIVPFARAEERTECLAAV